ncbi:MAG: hypothetical protein K5663_11430 [Clostridiales bacterium]|nr:hypothetical protein [Clostridiales bacterium]
MATFGEVDVISYGIRADIYLRGNFITPACSLLAEDIKDYSVNDTASSNALPLGTAAGKSFRLTFNNALEKTGYTAPQLDGAKVKVYVTDSRAGNSEIPAGVWFVEKADINEQDVWSELSGYDALGGRFNGTWTDNLTYPKTLLSLLQTVCIAAGNTTVSTTTFRNYNVSLSKKPAWDEKTTLRDIVGYIAFIAGGFARINYAGELEIYTLGGGSAHTLTPYQYTEFRGVGGARFDFNCLEYKFKDADDYTRYAVDSSIPGDATNTIQATGNPLVTKSLCNNIVQALRGLEYEGAEATWFASFLVQAGDTMTLTDKGGSSHLLFVTGQNLTFDSGGITGTVESSLPSISQSTAAYSTSASVFNPDGTINYRAIGNLDRKVISVNNAWIGTLTANEITTKGLLANIIEAVKLHAQNISATEVATDELTAMAAEIVNATIRKLDAGTISTDELMAGHAELLAAKIGTLTAGSILTDELAAALAAFTVITAGSASFDRATITHLVASALNLEYGVGDEVFIKNLSVDYAKMVHAYVGDLCVRAADGKYYLLNVGQDGSVTASEYTDITDSEITEGVTDNGQTIIETEITTGELSASTIKGVYALINRLDAARIDVDSLYAREAFIDRLNTTDISANQYLRITLDAQQEQMDESTGRLDTINRYITFDEDGMRQRKSGSIYSTLVDDMGFHIDREGTAGHLASFAGDGLTVDQIRIGDIVAKKTSTRGWAWQGVD